MNRRPIRLLCTVAAGLVVLASCASGPFAGGPAETAPPVSITRYADAAPPRPPEQVAVDNRAIAQAALPTDADLPGFASASPTEARLLLCPTATETVPDSIVHASGSWSGTGDQAGRTLTVTVVFDPEKAPADRLLATLLPQDCAEDAGGFHYVYDRQPFEQSDGWSGALNTILATDTRTGQHSYRTAYLVSKGDALVNVVASRADRETFDPSVDETAAHALELVLGRFAG
ncbi:hypothetical protein MOQ72_04885 [Saccharopolyspora sp. K220]|uniref:hypothetical protein n=1 Tax=Saccharopolyspora soli TaxID=2926618 RepID=UPI001F599427|nr:hypothetical protein [Saccharopolyspora soli]MCI2416750.1 hypothetical protein [Saccharopolyspora soli]